MWERPSCTTIRGLLCSVWKPFQSWTLLNSLHSCPLGIVILCPCLTGVVFLWPHGLYRLFNKGSGLSSAKTFLTYSVSPEMWKRTTKLRAARDFWKRSVDPELQRMPHLCIRQRSGVLCSTWISYFRALRSSSMFIIGDQDGRQRGNAWHGQETMSNEEQMRELGMINFTKRRQRKSMVSLLRYSKTCQVEKVARFVLRYPGRQTKVIYLKVSETNLNSAKKKFPGHIRNSGKQRNPLSLTKARWPQPLGFLPTEDFLVFCVVNESTPGTVEKAHTMDRVTVSSLLRHGFTNGGRGNTWRSQRVWEREETSLRADRIQRKTHFLPFWLLPLLVNGNS